LKWIFKLKYVGYIYYALRKDKGIFSPSAIYFISEDAERISVHFSVGMYNKILTSAGYFLFSGAYV
jgi:hypothetical protein